MGFGEVTYLPQTVPPPEPTMDDAAFWEHCKHERLMFQSCAACSRLRHPPTPFCPECQAVDVIWREAPAVARVYTFTVIHHASHPSVREALPYVVAVVEFPNFGNVRFISNVNAPPESVSIGMEVELFWERGADTFVLPRFRPRQAPK